MTRAYGAYIAERGHPNRSLVLIDERGVVRWVHESETPLEIPGANLIFDALDSAGAELTFAAPRCPRSGSSITSRGVGPEAIVYVDLACPHCAAGWPRIRELALRLCVRHFPVASKRPRATALHAAAEAASMQREAAFWELCDSIYADQGHQDDPHLWARARGARPRSRAVRGRAAIGARGAADRRRLPERDQGGRHGDAGRFRLRPAASR